MAAPHVAGAAAMLLQLQPRTSVDSLRRALQRAAINLVLQEGSAPYLVNVEERRLRRALADAQAEDATTAAGR